MTLATVKLGPADAGVRISRADFADAVVAEPVERVRQQ
jgi:hypothetical protein